MADERDFMALMHLSEDAYQNAVDHGWYDGDDKSTVGDRIALMHTELSEAYEEWRDGHSTNQIYIKEGKPEGVPIELADVIIRILDFAGREKIDIARAVELKMLYNKTRPRFEDYNEARAVMAVLRKHEHEITYDWTVEADAHLTGTQGSETERAVQAGLDLEGVRNADIILVLTRPLWRLRHVVRDGRRGGTRKACPCLRPWT